MSAASNEDRAHEAWLRAYTKEMAGRTDNRCNRSGLAMEPLYRAADVAGLPEPGLPDQPPYTRGIHASMYCGRPWSQRLVVGLGFPADYNRRMRALYAAGAHGLYVAPCNSHMRGFDADAVEPELLGTCGTVINTVDDLATCLDGLPWARESVSLGDSAPFTLSAMLLALARRGGVSWRELSGTTNQSDYLSHYCALHMFMRLSPAGARRLLLDHVAFMLREAPHWYPISVVGQHMQQAGASPAEAMAFALALAQQHADDLVARGLAPDDFLPKFSFFFDVSLSFFEEIAKFRAGRRVWARLVQARYGARHPRSMALRFHAQTAGTDLTRQRPLNNIARVAVQAMAAIFGGAQSLHTDAWDEALSAPAAGAARVAVDTQNILREEALLDQVVDPLGGAYFIEHHTAAMEAEIEHVMAEIENVGGMYAAASTGWVQARIGRSAAAFQNAVDEGRYRPVGVADAGTPDDDWPPAQAVPRPAAAARDAYLARLTEHRRQRDRDAVARALDELAEALAGSSDNAYGRVVEALERGATHGEICQRARDAVGDAAPLVVV